jgi:glycosyltransferase involved in cell wall biosynthesis
MRRQSARLCFIGNLLGGNPDHPVSQSQLLVKLFTSEGYEVRCASSKLNRLARLADIIAVLITGRQRFDAVVLDLYSNFYFLAADIASLLCKLFRIPLIMVMHGGELPEFVRRFPRWTKRVLDRPTLLTAPSPFLAREIGALGYDVRVIPNVVDLSLYPFRERSEIRPKLIWMRSFHPIYNPEMAIRVLARLRESQPDAILTMAGSDKGLENNSRSAAREFGVADAVRFVGFLNWKSKLEELSAADIYLNTNRKDNMPVSVVEAQAMGLPVVATNVGGLPFLIENGKNGFLVPTEDANQMAAKIKTLLDNPQTTASFSRNGRASAEQSSWASVKPLWEALFSEVMGSGPMKRHRPSGNQTDIALNGGL